MSPQCTFAQSKVLLLSNVRSGVGACACLFPSSAAEKKRRPIYPGGFGSMSEQTSSGVLASSISLPHWHFVSHLHCVLATHR
ncbi:uncharacterized [Tachysurus ichikawai]